MKKKSFGAILITVMTFIKAESELYTHVTEIELPGSRALHSRLGFQDCAEKQYATITFKKKTNDDALLTILGLTWHGPAFSESFCASLFKLDGNGFFLPTDDYLVAETRLNDHQELRFRLNKPLELMGTTSFALVLVVSPRLEEELTRGNFSFMQDLLPEAFQSASQETIAFAIKPNAHSHS